MRLIKFRGRTRNGDVYYGGCMQILHTGTTYIVGGSGGGSHRKFYRVKPETIQQLVGYDRNGEEVYEGDTLIDDPENEFTAEIYMRPEQIERLILR